MTDVPTNPPSPPGAPSETPTRPPQPMPERETPDHPGIAPPEPVEFPGERAPIGVPVPEEPQIIDPSPQTPEIPYA